MKPAIPIVLALAACLAACDSAGDDLADSDLVVEAFLESGKPLPLIRISRAARIDQEYDYLGLGVSSAVVELDLLSDSGTSDNSQPYRESDQYAGIYYAQSRFARVKPLAAYRLRISLPETGETVTATTVAPDTFAILATTDTTVVYQGTEQLEVTLTRSSYPGRQQNYFIFVTQALDPREEFLTPIAAARLETDGLGAESLEALAVNGSPILSEDNYDLNADGTLTVRYPWIAINFYGPNRIYINALDDNLYDFFRSQSVQQGGSTLAPGEIPNPLENVTGAHGVFGAFSRVSLGLDVLRQ